MSELRQWLPNWGYEHMETADGEALHLEGDGVMFVLASDVATLEKERDELADKLLGILTDARLLASCVEDKLLGEPAELEDEQPSAIEAAQRILADKTLIDPHRRSGGGA